MEFRACFYSIENDSMHDRMGKVLTISTCSGGSHLLMICLLVGPTGLFDFLVFLGS